MYRRCCKYFLIIGTCLTSLISLSSCSNGINFSWKGHCEDFACDYQKYDNPSIALSEAFPTYLHHNNFNTMFFQDSAFSICDSVKESTSNEITLQMNLIKVDTSTFRFSYNFCIIDNESNKKIIEAQINKLEYKPCLDKNTSPQSLYFVPNNISISNGSIKVNESFWTSDINFEILINDYNKNKSYVFSYRCQDDDDQYDFTNDYAKFLLINPFYYSETTILS